MPAPWPTNPESPILQIRDPVHYLYKRVLVLPGLDLDLRDHCIQLMAPFLRADKDERHFNERSLLAFGLGAHIQATRLARELEKEEPGTERHTALSVTHIRFIEAL